MKLSALFPFLLACVLATSITTPPTFTTSIIVLTPSTTISSPSPPVTSAPPQGSLSVTITTPLDARATDDSDKRGDLVLQERWWISTYYTCVELEESTPCGTHEQVLKGTGPNGEFIYMGAASSSPRPPSRLFWRATLVILLGAVLLAL